jgi:hypothetical protein
VEAAAPSIARQDSLRSYATSAPSASGQEAEEELEEEEEEEEM